MKTLSRLFRTACTAFHIFFVLALLTTSARADDTTLTTQVPEQHTVELTISGAGTVTVNGTEYTASSDIMLPRHREVEITVTAADGYKIKSVYYNTENVTAEIVGGKWTIPALQEDGTLSVTFLKRGGAPQTGDDSNLYVLWAGLFLSCGVLLLCRPRARQRCRR